MQVAEPIESAIKGVPRLEKLQSTSANSVALVVAQFAFGTDVKEAVATIEANVAKAGLPASVDPTVQALNINASPVIIASIAATSPDGLDEAAAIANNEILAQIRGLDGVGSADLTGGLEPQIYVTLDPAKMAEAGVTNPAGHRRPPGQQPDASVRSASGRGPEDPRIDDRRAEFGRADPGPARRRPPASDHSRRADGHPAPGTPPAIPTPVFLKDVATVEVTDVATTGYARTNGQPALTLTVTKTSNGNTVNVAEEVQAVLTDAQATHADTISITVVQDLSKFILESQDGLLREGGLGALFAILTIFLFLFSLRSTLVAAISIPLSVLAALVLMQVADISLNVMTLGGLAVAVGRVVDDAIVVLENIYRHRAMGEDRLTASIQGPEEVARASRVSTLTTVVVFLPIGFVGGIVSQLFLPFALTVTFALLASLICALTVVPVLAYLFINKVPTNVDADGEPKNSFWIRVYTPLITGVLRNRWTKLGVLGVSAVLFFASLALVGGAAHTVHQHGLRKDRRDQLAPPAGAARKRSLLRQLRPRRS